MKRLPFLTVLFFCVSLLCLFWVRPVVADDFFRWTDDSGKAVYGSNPPHGAKGVTSVKGGAFSRYSSKKMLRAFSATNTAQHAGMDEIKETNLLATTGPDAANVVDHSDTANSSSVAVSSSVPKGQIQTVALEHGEPKILRNNAEQVVGCEVMVKNPSNQTAKNVVVTLRFRDGTVIQAQGPEEVRGMEEVIYSVPEGQLQISLPEIPTLAEDSFELPEDSESQKQVTDVDILVVFNS